MKSLRYILFFFIALFILQSNKCVSYNQGGRSFGDSVTVSVMPFTNSASLAKATFPQTLTEALKDGIQKQAKLTMVPHDGTLNYEGNITGYSVSPVAVQAGGTNQSSMNRLSITVSVKYTDGVYEPFSFESSFTRYSDFSASVPLSSVEDQLIKDISDQLVQDIINKSINAW